MCDAACLNSTSCQGDLDDCTACLVQDIPIRATDDDDPIEDGPLVQVGWKRRNMVELHLIQALVSRNWGFHARP